MDSHRRKRSHLDRGETAGGGGGEISVLGECLLLEILLRIPPSSLLSSLSVSKSWLGLCTSLFFRLSYCSRRASPFLGFFINFPCRSPFFLPSFSAPAVAAVADPGPVQILDSRGGWLLLRDISSSLRLFHPIANKSVVVPTSSKSPAAAFHALLPDPFSAEPLGRFRILRVAVQPSSRLQIEMFSSESPEEWKDIKSSRLVRLRRCSSEPEVHPVLVEGFLHWLNGGRQILALDEKSYELNIVGLPRELPLYLTHRCLGKLDGRLCYAYVEESCLYVWLLVDRSYFEWSLEHRIEMYGFREQLGHDDVEPIAFGGGGSSSVVFLVSMEKIFSLDLKRRGLRELCSAGFKIDHVFPYNWMDGV